MGWSKIRMIRMIATFQMTQKQTSKIFAPQRLSTLFLLITSKICRKDQEAEGDREFRDKLLFYIY